MFGWGRVRLRRTKPQRIATVVSADARSQPPIVRLVGDTDHPDFRDAIALLRGTTRLSAGDKMPPELIVVCQCRPDVISNRELTLLSRDAPLAGIVALLGSWCEGETRTGRPWPGAHRLYWCEFPAWWRRQLQLRAAFRCPDWARPASFLPQRSDPEHPRPRSGVIVLHTPRRDNADTLADCLQHEGYSTIWQPPCHPRPLIRGIAAGIWDGAQLNEPEAEDLASFCTHMARRGASVIALLDFPRRDSVDRAIETGAKIVLGKPWLNSDLISTLDAMIEAPKLEQAA